MTEPISTPAATPAPAAQDPSILADAGKSGDPTVLDEAAKAATEAKTKEEADLLAADPSTLSEEQKTQRTQIETRNEEKRLLGTPEDQLSAEDKAKKQALVKAKADADKAKQGAPEKYEAFKVPEGVTLNQAALDKVTPIFKELNLSQPAAQKLVDTFVNLRNEEKETRDKEWKDTQKAWKEETQKVLGANYKTEVAYLAKVRDNFFSPETQELLDAAGLSNNKSFILDMIKIGKLFGEDKLPDGKLISPTPISREKQMYPNLA